MVNGKRSRNTHRGQVDSSQQVVGRHISVLVKEFICVGQFGSNVCLCRIDQLGQLLAVDLTWGQLHKAKAQQNKTTLNTASHGDWETWRPSADWVTFYIQPKRTIKQVEPCQQVNCHRINPDCVFHIQPCQVTIILGNP